MENWHVIVLGSKGMLGNYVYKYLYKKGFHVFGITRNEIDARFATVSIIDKLLVSLVSPEKNILIINCIGLIKPLNATPQEYIIVNSMFPHLLENVCMAHGWKLIHPSTDCVFDSRGNYKEDDLIDAKDIYGTSKAAGEPLYSTVIRTSIIGEEFYHKYSLIEWIKSNFGKSVKGFINHKWNGITCLQYAILIEYITLNNLFWKGPRHIFSPMPISKCELIKLVNSIYNLGITVEEVSAEKACDKTLSTIYSILPIPDIKDQVRQMFLFPLI